MNELERPVLFAREHETAPFDCGKEPLNRFLKGFALANQASGSSRTYVAMVDGRVIGYYSLTPSSVSPSDAPERVSQGQALHEIGVVLMARFAVDLEFQGRGIGRSLFLDALGRVVQASDVIGGRAFLVHAKDEEAKAFYMKFNMMPAPGNSLHLYLLLKDVRKTLAEFGRD